MACGVGVIGAGIVGGGVIQTLLSNSGVISDKTGATVELRHVADINLENLNVFDLEGIKTSSDANALIEDPEVDVVCELIGGEEPARSFILKAMEAGKHVVTANKMLLAIHGRELTAKAVEHGVELRYEAAVAGAIPIIKALREGLAVNHIRAIYGILNGTCNYILTRMTEDEQDFAPVLQQAIMQGFAETPPDLDIEGHDTAHKCQILASLAYSTPINLDDIYVEGVTKVTHVDVANARDMGYQIKLLAIIQRVDGEVEARVHPTLVPQDHLLASVRNEFNAIFVSGDISDDTLYYGRGAGRLPTASAVVGDVVDIAGNTSGQARAPFQYTHDLAVRDIGLLTGRYYLRLTTEDHPGVLGNICSCLGQHGVSISSCIQQDENDNMPAHIVLMTHTCLESSIAAAIQEIDANSFVLEPTHLLRVL